MTKSTPVPIDGRDVILRDKYRAIVAEYSSEIVEILQARQIRHRGRHRKIGEMRQRLRQCPPAIAEH
jgi:hypothetical protein